MFQLFLRARARNFSRNHLGGERFKVRSSERDEDTDRQRVETVMNAIETVLSAAEHEQKGLNQRVDDVLARAAVTVGNDTDEYLTRDAQDTHYQNLLALETSRGQLRLSELEASIAHYRFLKAALLSRFPDATASLDTRKSGPPKSN